MNKKGQYCKIIDKICQEVECRDCQAWIDYWYNFLARVEKEERAWDIIKANVENENRL